MAAAKCKVIVWPGFLFLMVCAVFRDVAFGFVGLINWFRLVFCNGLKTNSTKNEGGLVCGNVVFG